MKTVGQLNADEFFADMFGGGGQDDSKRGFQDSSLAGASLLLNRAKRQFEAKEDTKPLVVSKGVEKRRQCNVAAVNFEIKRQLAVNKQLLSPKSKGSEAKKEWAWKKKSPEELAKQFDDLEGTKEEHVDHNSDEKDVVDPEALLKKIHETMKRLKAKNPDKDHEKKIEEYSKFMEDIQGYLEEPISPQEDPFLWEAMLDQQRLEAETSNRGNSTSKVKPVITLTNIEAIKSKIRAD